MAGPSGKSQAQRTAHLLPLNGQRDFYGGRCGVCNEWQTDAIGQISEDNMLEYVCRSCRKVRQREAHKNWRRHY